jgi:biotin carboxyl carrier protein
MRRIAPLVVAALACAGLPPAAAAGAGGASAPSASGGTEYGAPLGKPRAKRPVAALFSVAPRAVTAGARPPRISLRIDQQGVRTVRARVVFWPLRGRGSVLRLDLGRVRTGQRLEPRWPAGQQLVAGSYVVRLHATGPAGGPLLRKAHASGRAALTVKPAPAPKPLAPVTPAAPLTSGTFPVAGPHTYGGEDAKFGAGRDGHTHEGQDVAAAEGTPVVAPVPGTITVRAYQEGGAGFYLVQATADGRHFFYAHCKKDTFAVAEGQSVAAGQQLCQVGSTGSSSGPHLHFEIWIGGWRASKDSHPVDPLPQLLEWDPSA